MTHSPQARRAAALMTPNGDQYQYATAFDVLTADFARYAREPVEQVRDGTLALAERDAPQSLAPLRGGELNFTGHRKEAA